MGYSLPLAHLLLRRHLLIILKIDSWSFASSCWPSARSMPPPKVSSVDFSVSLKSAPVTVLDSEPDPLDLVEFLRPEQLWLQPKTVDLPSLLEQEQPHPILSSVSTPTDKARASPSKINSKYLVEFYYVMTIQIVFMS